MKDIKYQYAYDENKILVSINDYTKETSKQHTFKCIGCDGELCPRAIDSKHRRAHFFHKESVLCNEETYLHKLSKLYIKNYFDNSDRFYISYKVSKTCNNSNCNLRNYNCFKENEIYEIDLKEFYDTCTIEATIEGFVADLLLTNSKDPSNSPILLEICVTHSCDKIKRESGLQIIEIHISTEKDINELFRKGCLSENLNKRSGSIIEFISFKRDIEEKLISPISRFVFHPTLSPIPFKNEIRCDIADNKIFENSVVELNVVSMEHHPVDDHSSVVYRWLVNRINLKRCNICKFHYATTYDDHAFCRLSAKYGKPKYPDMEYAEKCSSFRVSDYLLSDSEKRDDKVLEVTNGQVNTNKMFRVIIAGSHGFDDYTLFENRCNHFLSKKIKTHNVIIFSGTSIRTTAFINQYSNEHNLIVVPFDAQWVRYGKNAGNISNEKMINCADALIAFWDGKSKYTAHLIELAKSKGLPAPVIRY